MSITTTESTTATVAGEPSMVDLMVDGAALVGRIGTERVLSVTVARGVLTIDVRPGVDAWEAGRSLGLNVCKVDPPFGTREEADRVAFGVPARAGSVPFLEVRGETFPGDPGHYEAPAYVVRDRDAEREHSGRGGQRSGWTDRD